MAKKKSSSRKRSQKSSSKMKKKGKSKKSSKKPKKKVSKKKTNKKTSRKRAKKPKKKKEVPEEEETAHKIACGDCEKPITPDEVAGTNHNGMGVCTDCLNTATDEGRNYKSRVKPVEKEPESEETIIEWADKPAIEQDREVTEVVGIVKTVQGFTSDRRCKVQMTIKDKDGALHNFYCKLRSFPFWSVLCRMDLKTYGEAAKTFYDLDPIQQDLEMKRLIAMQKEDYLFRIAENRAGDPELYACVTKKWRPYHVEDVVNHLKGKVAGSIQITTPETGRYGGDARIRMAPIADLAEPQINIRCGRKDGSQSLQMHGGANILACANQLSFEVSKKFREINLPRTTIDASKIHRIEVDIIELVRTIEEGLGEIRVILEGAKQIELKKKRAFAIISWYVQKGYISKKTEQAVIKALMDDKISQVPNTVYGLAMALSWVGTNDPDRKAGVQAELQRIAGEITIMSQKWDEYLKVIEVEQIEIQDNPES